MSEKQKVKVKICGLRRLEDVEAVNRYRPDYVGFVFARSKRQVTPDEAKRLSGKIRPDIRRVGVFVDQSPELLAQLLLDGTVDFLQLHGAEDAAYEQTLSQLLREGGIRKPQEHLIKAYRIRGREDFENLGQTMCKYLLLDAYSVKCEGGNGESFDWSLITRIQKPFFLAGGIGLNNVEAAVKDVRPYGVDVSSSLETDGYKDETKIKQFMERIRSYE
ncbi:MAG: phosphoribosylanthranilate isomerase [Lachnospiraceae bacterium]|nr:phosphoribosylanthranilate isomerase [Lachnospiraceae bacterium]